MKELALHILDLVQNSVAAEATKIEIEIVEDLKADILSIAIGDNGKGMAPEYVKKVMDPFVTSRTTRKVGLGISLMQAACERCQGGLSLDSQLGVGTWLKASFQHSHIDRAPLGNMPDTIVSLVLCCNGAELIYRHQCNDGMFCFDTREIKEALGDDVSLAEPDILSWIRDYIQEGLTTMQGGQGK